MKWVHKADLFIACYQLGEASILCCVNRAVKEYDIRIKNTDSYKKYVRNSTKCREITIKRSVVREKHPV